MSIESDITALAATYAVSNINASNCDDYFDLAAGRSTWTAARPDINFVSEHVQGMGNNITAYVGGATNYLCPNILLAINQRIDGLSAPAITMAAILSAMVAATPAEVLYFVGLVDAYRQSVWEVEFNQEYFAALAKGFMP